MKRFQRSILACCAGLLLFANAEPVEAQQKLRFQSALPPSTLMFQNAKFWAERVKGLSGGRLEIEVLPAGSVVPAFEVLDAVHKRVLDGGHTASAFWAGRNRAAVLFGATPGGPFGMDLTDYLGWIYESGGLELYRELYQDQMKRNVVPFPMTAVPQQPLGWFKNPVRSWDDLKGRKCRQTGLAAELFGHAGMTSVNIPPGEIIPAGDRGVIECGELVGPAEDMKVGFHTIWKHYYVTSMHEPAGILEVYFNGDVWKGLAPDLQMIVQSAAVEAALRSQSINNRLNAEALDEMRQKHGVKVERTPDDILAKTLQVWDQMAADEVAKNPFFKKVYDSQRAYAAKVVPARRFLDLPYARGANHYWPQPK